MMVSNRPRKKSFHQLKNYHARGQMTMNGIEIVTETETRGTFDLKRNLRKKSRDQEAEREIETEIEESANVVNHQNLIRTRIRIGIGIVTDETIEIEKEKEIAIAIEEENATELGIEVLKKIYDPTF